MSKPVKTIWLVNRYAMPPQYESRLRTIKFAHYLKEAGYDVTVFGASEMHNMDVNLIKDGSKYIVRDYGDIHFVHIRTLNYNHKGNVIRTLSDILFYHRVVSIGKQLVKPDCIIATTIPLITNPVVRYAKRCKSFYIQEILDFWPDDFVDFGLISAKNPIMKMLYAHYKKTYEVSDAIVGSPEGTKEYFINKKWDSDNGGPIELDKVFYINNGVDIADFEAWKNEFKIEDDDLSSDKKRVIYLGSVRMVNNIMQFIKAAELLKERSDVEFLVYGDGEDREELVKYTKDHNIRNVKWKDKWIDPKFVPFVLSQSYLNILNYMSSNFSKFGISSSKMFQYMASGRPILCNINIFKCPIAHYNIGIAREFNSPEEYAQAIETMLDLDKESYNAMCKRAREAAKDFDYPYLTQKQIDIIKWLESK